MVLVGTSSPRELDQAEYWKPLQKYREQLCKRT